MKSPFVYDESENNNFKNAFVKFVNENNNFKNQNVNPYGSPPSFFFQNNKDEDGLFNFIEAINNLSFLSTEKEE